LIIKIGFVGSKSQNSFARTVRSSFSSLGFLEITTIGLAARFYFTPWTSGANSRLILWKISLSASGSYKTLDLQVLELSLNNPIGIMQGRLVPSWSGKLQAFPRDRWEEEFSLAAEIGFISIEWLLDADTGAHNPLWEKEGPTLISQVRQKNTLSVPAVCADYVQGAPLSILDRLTRQKRGSKLATVVELAGQIGAQVVLVPCLEKDLMPHSLHQDALSDALTPVLDRALQLGVKVGLEMDWSATDQCQFVKQLSHPALGVYYDLGNATAKGYNPPEDLRLIGSCLVGVHIKDRKVGGGSVILGKGDTDFLGAFHVLREIGYEGPLILETPRGSDPLATARQHLTFVENAMMDVTSPERIES
jgi:sugar phosphate isomerase/epimerase